MRTDGSKHPDFSRNAHAHAFLLVVLAACGGSEGDSGTGPAPALQVAARTDTIQAGLTGHAVSKPPSVRLTRSGVGVGGVAVTFAVVEGEGTLEGAVATTDGNGVATVGSWKPGRIGVNRLTASAPGAVGSPGRFQTNADAGPMMMARYVFDDSVNLGTASAPQWVAARIRGDGRARDGRQATSAPLGGEYQGGFCGVNSLIGRGPDFDEHDNFRSNTSQFWNASLPASCQPSRGIRFYVDGLDKPPHLLAALVVVEQIRTMNVGESRIQEAGFQTGGVQAGAIGGLVFKDGIIFGMDNATSGARVTRLPDIRDELGRPVHQWRVESQGTHRAQNEAAAIYAPFAMTITEVPYPYPTYP